MIELWKRIVWKRNLHSCKHHLSKITRLLFSAPSLAPCSCSSSAFFFSFWFSFWFSLSLSSSSALSPHPSRIGKLTKSGENHQKYSETTTTGPRTPDPLNIFKNTHKPLKKRKTRHDATWPSNPLPSWATLPCLSWRSPYQVVSFFHFSSALYWRILTVSDNFVTEYTWLIQFLLLRVGKTGRAVFRQLAETTFPQTRMGLLTSLGTPRRLMSTSVLDDECTVREGHMRCCTTWPTTCYFL